MDCSSPGSSVHKSFPARTLEWGAICSSRGSFRPGLGPASPAPAGPLWLSPLGTFPGLGSITLWLPPMSCQSGRDFFTSPRREDIHFGIFSESGFGKAPGDALHSTWVYHPSCRNPVQNGWGWQWAGRQESLSCDLTRGVSVKLDSLAADRSRRRTQIRGVRKRKLSEWGHRVRESRGFDADWLCLMLRKTRSILIGRILCLCWERLSLPCPADVRLVSEPGCWALAAAAKSL